MSMISRERVGPGQPHLSDYRMTLPRGSKRILRAGRCGRPPRGSQEAYVGTEHLLHRYYRGRPELRRALFARMLGVDPRAHCGARILNIAQDGARGCGRGRTKPVARQQGRGRPIPARPWSSSAAILTASWPPRASSTRSSAASKEIERVIQILSRRTKNNPVPHRRAGRGQNGHRRGAWP